MSFLVHAANFLLLLPFPFLLLASSSLCIAEGKSTSEIIHVSYMETVELTLAQNKKKQKNKKQQINNKFLFFFPVLLSSVPANIFLSSDITYPYKEEHKEKEK